jgi:hypothetical protein
MIGIGCWGATFYVAQLVSRQLEVMTKGSRSC